mgnify:CR=1 FL=1|jgi:hypothetical protein
MDEPRGIWEVGDDEYFNPIIYSCDPNSIWDLWDLLE